MSRSNLNLARPRFDIVDSELGIAVTVAQDSLDVGEVEVGPLAPSHVTGSVSGIGIPLKTMRRKRASEVSLEGAEEGGTVNKHRRVI